MQTIKRTVLLAATLAVGFSAAAGPARAQSLDFSYFCKDADETGYYLHLGKGTALEVRQHKSSEIHTGSYDYGAGGVALSVPSLGFAERSTAADVRRGFLIAFTTPSIRCTQIGHGRGPAVEGSARCPAIKPIPSYSYETNIFTFYRDHSVKRERQTALVKLGNTLYETTYGIYLIEGDRLYMAFGWSEGERELTGRILAGQSFTIDQLEPGRGPCKPDEE